MNSSSIAPFRPLLAVRPRPRVGNGFRLGIFDTSALTSDITSALKRGRPSSLQTEMQDGTVRGFIPHYVWAEVPRVLADRKREGGAFDLAVAEDLWWQVYIPLLHVVCVTGLPMTAEAHKVAREDFSDVGAVQLAGLLAPVVVLASDPDLVRHGVAAPKWGDLRALLGEIGTADTDVWTRTLTMTAAGRGLLAALRLARANPLAAGVVAGAAGAYAYRNRARLSDPAVRASLGKVSVSVLAHLGEPFGRQELHERVWTQAQYGTAGADLLSQVARLLARAPMPLTRTEILQRLPQPPAEAHRRQMDGLTRLLHRFPAFHQAEPGRWQLGRTGVRFTATPQAPAPTT